MLSDLEVSRGGPAQAVHQGQRARDLRVPRHAEDLRAPMVRGEGRARAEDLGPRDDRRDPRACGPVDDEELHRGQSQTHDEGYVVLSNSTASYTVRPVQIVDAEPNPVGPTPNHWLISDTYDRPYDRFRTYAELISRKHLVLAEDLL